MNSGREFNDSGDNEISDSANQPGGGGAITDSSAGQANPSDFEVSGSQIDPGMHDWVKVLVHVYNAMGLKTTVASVIATATADQSYDADTEYWHGHDGALTALANAVTMEFEHTGDYDWDDFNAEWGSVSGRHSPSLTAPVTASYQTASSGPSVLFQGVHSNGTTSLRAMLTFDSHNDLVAVYWAHTATGSPAPYLIASSTNTTLTKNSDPSWTSGWKSATFE